MKIHHKCIKCGTTVYTMGVNKRKYLALQTEKKKEHLSSKCDLVCTENHTYNSAASA